MVNQKVRQRQDIDNFSYDVDNQRVVRVPFGETEYGYGCSCTMVTTAFSDFGVMAWEIFPCEHIREVMEYIKEHTQVG